MILGRDAPQSLREEAMSIVSSVYGGMTKTIREVMAGKGSNCVDPKLLTLAVEECEKRLTAESLVRDLARVLQITMEQAVMAGMGDTPLAGIPEDALSRVPKELLP